MQQGRGLRDLDVWACTRRALRLGRNLSGGPLRRSSPRSRSSGRWCARVCVEVGKLVHGSALLVVLDAIVSAFEICLVTD